MMDYTKKELKTVAEKTERFESDGYTKKDAVLFGLIEFLEDRVKELREKVWDYDNYEV